MKNCNVIQDLIPLYAEGLTNEDSTALVEQHLTECSECQSYYEMIKQDVEEIGKQQPDETRIDYLGAILAKYQQRIKLFGVLVAMLMSCVIVGAEVQFLTTIPFLIFTPYICRLFYHRSWPIIISSIPFGFIGGVLSEENASYIPFFTVIALITAIVGVGAAVLMNYGVHRYTGGLSASFKIASIMILVVSFSAYFSFWGNPISYVNTMVKSKSYVSETYEEGTLSFKGVGYNFKDKSHYGKFEYVLNGTRQIESITIQPDGEVYDRYKYILDMQFSEERSADLRTEIAAAIDYAPVFISAEPAEEIHVTRDEMNEKYYHLSYDIERRDKATEVRNSEAGKIKYAISFGQFVDEYDQLLRDEFLEKSVAILHALEERDFPYAMIEVKAFDFNGQQQRVSFDQSSSEQQLLDSYTIGD